MTDQVIVKRFSANTSSGEQSFDTTKIGGKTPKGCLLYWGYATGVVGVQPDASWNVGACDGTNQWAITGADDDANATSTLNRRGSLNTACIYQRDPAGVSDFLAAFVNFHADGLRVDWTNPPTS